MGLHPDAPREADVVEPDATPQSPVTFGGAGGSTSLTLGDAMTCYRRWPSPTAIVADGPYGLAKFPGEPDTADALGKWYAPHVAEPSLSIDTGEQVIPQFAVVGVDAGVLAAEDVNGRGNAAMRGATSQGLGQDGRLAGFDTGSYHDLVGSDIGYDRGRWWRA